MAPRHLGDGLNYWICEIVRLLACLIPVLFQDFCIFWRKFNLCSLKSWYITGSSIVIRGTDYSFRVLLSIIVKMSSFSRRGFWRKRGRTGSYSQVISWTTVLYDHIRPPRHTHGVQSVNTSSWTWFTWRKIIWPPLTCGLAYMALREGVGFHHLC